MSYLYPTVKKALALVFSLTVISQVSFAQLSFLNPVLTSGTDLQQGAVYRYNNVAPGTNAIVTIESIVNGSTILQLDESGAGYDNGFQPKIQSGGTGNSYVLFSISFVSSTSGSPVSFAALNSTILDIDGDNNVKEFAEVSVNNAVGSLFTGTPQISLQNGSGKSTGSNVAGVEVGGIDVNAKEVMFQVAGMSVSTIKIKFGTNSDNSSHAARQYSLYFPSFASAASLPVTLISFQAMLKDKYASLVWTTSNHSDFSNFVVEKSTDGKNFRENAVLFAESNSSATHDYNYKDNLQNNTSGVIYYRLKMVDIDGKYTYSEIRMVRLATEENRVQITTFPNPVTNEVRVMIPAEWQEKAVTYELYNNNGSLVQRVQNQKAAQVQQLNVQQLNGGNYIVKVSNGVVTSTSKIVKIN